MTGPEDDRLRVAVLMGGRSSERDISLMSGRKVAAALDPAKYIALPVVVDDHLGFVRSVLGEAEHPGGDAQGGFDVAFIALHGAFGEDTGSGVLASALALDKAMSKRVFASAQIPTPASRLLRTGELGDDPSLLWPELARELGTPLVVKPNAHGSSVAVSIVRRREDLAPALRWAAEHDKHILVERFVAGTEISIGVLGNDSLEVLPVVEVVPRDGFYDYQAKYTPGATEEICPARIPPDVASRAQRLALASHSALGCRGMSRVDMIVGGEEIWVLEVNTIPGMTETSLLPLAAKTVGIEFPQLVERLLSLAVGR
jgi:D-alanine-D-alanine ligase